MSLLISGDFSIDIETTGLELDDAVVCAAIAWREGLELKTKAFWLDALANDSSEDIFVFHRLLDDTLFNSSYTGTVIFHNANFDLVRLWNWKNSKLKFSSRLICKISDTLMISRVARNNKFISHISPKKRSCHSLKYLAEEFFGESYEDFGEATGHGNIRLANRSVLLAYNQNDAAYTLRLHEYFKSSLTSNEWDYLEKIETPHLLNLVHMNLGGVPYNAQEAENFLADLVNRRTRLETTAHILVGQTFNLSSLQEVSRSLFYNNRLTYWDNGERKVLKPLFLTSNGQPKVDLDTLREIHRRLDKFDDCSPLKTFIESVMLYTETSKAISMLENHLSRLYRANGDIRIFPNFSAEAKSGRLKSSRPNLLGIPKKIFKKTEFLKDNTSRRESLRSLLAAKPDHEIWSIDINALDLTVIAQGASQYNSDFEWIGLFKKSLYHNIDIHMAIASRMDNERYVDKLAPISCQLKNPLPAYVALKYDEERKTMDFLHESGVLESTQFPDDDSKTLNEIKNSRTLSKQINLSTAYGMGGKTLAKRLGKELGKTYSYDEAVSKLDSFFSVFPEVRQFQDQIANQTYTHGYATSIFGRRYYADVFDELNSYHNNLINTADGVFEFICNFKSSYWYIKTRHWKKETTPVIENMSLARTPFGLKFEDVLCIEKLDKAVFVKTMEKKLSKFNRKNEQSDEDVHNFVFNRMQISNLVDKQLSDGWSLSAEAESLLNRMMYEGDYFLNEKSILFYRVSLQEPSSRYFRFYRPFFQCARKFFPLYCQGVAATVASICLTQVREEIEKQNLDAQILLFVHDQIDVMVRKEQSQQMQNILISAIQSPKPPFDIQVTGSLKGPLTCVQ